MKKTKYKVGDLVTAPHIGECEVRKVVVVDDRVLYVLDSGGQLFTVAASEIEEAER